MKVCSFRNGFSVGFSWVSDGTGHSSKRSAVLCSFHPPRSITWLWAVYWHKPGRFFCTPEVQRFRPPGGEIGSTTITLPIIGGITFSWQKEMQREATK